MDDKRKNRKKNMAENADDTLITAAVEEGAVSDIRTEIGADEGAATPGESSDGVTADVPESPVVKELAKMCEELAAELADANDRYLRLAAEFDNFKKRSAKERESLGCDTVISTVLKLLPALDALDLAVAHAEEDPGSLRDGVVLVKKSFDDAFTKLGICEIPTDIPFNPELHSALMHIEDENLPENSIAEVLQKGFTIDGRVIRYALVSVAN